VTRRARRQTSCLAAAALLAPAAVAAFVPPGSFVLGQAGKAARRRAGLTAAYTVTGPQGARGRATLVVAGSGKAQLAADPPPPAVDLVRLLLAGDAAGAAAELSAASHPTALAWFDGHAAVIVGARRDEAYPQLWIDHERFVPLRARVGRLDVRLLDTAGLLSTAGLPARVEVWSDGARVWAAHLASRPSKRRR